MSQSDLNALLAEISPQYGGSKGTGVSFGGPNLMASIQGGFSDQSQFDAAKQANPVLAQLEQAGAIGFDNNGRWFSDQSKFGGILPTNPYGGYGGFEFMPATSSPSGSSHVGLDQSGNPYISQSSYDTSSGAAVVGNPSAVKLDPFYGYTTPQGNLKTYNKNSFLDQLMSTILPGLIGAGFGAGFAGLTGLPNLLTSILTDPTQKPGVGDLPGLLKSIGMGGG